MSFRPGKIQREVESLRGRLPPPSGGRPSPFRYPATDRESGAVSENPSPDDLTATTTSLPRGCPHTGDGHGSSNPPITHSGSDTASPPAGARASSGNNPAPLR